MPLFYADASALVKLVRREGETDVLRAYIDAADLVSTALVLAEVPRAIRRAAGNDPRVPLKQLMVKAGEVLDAVALLPVDEAILTAAGALVTPGLRALDAIHVVSAVALLPIDAFISYDDRQGAAARLAGLRTTSPGARTGAAAPSRRADSNR